MAFENYTDQYRELFYDFTQFSPFLLPELNFNTISRIKKDNKPSSVGQTIVNNQGKIVSLNQKFISIWKLPQYVVTARCERQVFQFIVEQLENSRSFSTNVRKIHERRLLEIQDQVKLKDGRTFMYLIKPQWFEKIIVGRIYQFQHLL